MTKMKRIALSSAVLAVALAAVAITVLAKVDEAPVAPAQADARVRVIHASPDAPAVDVLVNGTDVFTDTAFGDITDYAVVPAGTYTVTLEPAVGGAPVFTETLVVEEGTDYTVAAAGTFTTTDVVDFELLPLVDDNRVPALSKARARFVHLSPDAPAVDIAVKDGPVLFSNVGYRGVGDYVEVTAGTYDLEVRLAGTSVALLTAPVTVDPNNVYTVFATGLAFGTPPIQALPSVDQAYARVRAFHAVSDAPSVDVLVDGGAAFSDVAYKDITAYAALVSGTYTIGLASTGTVTPVLTQTLVLTGGMDFTLAAAGTLTTTDMVDFELLPFEDDNSPPEAGKAHVRVVHLSPDAPAVDIAVKGGPTLFSDVSYREATPYVPVDADSYDLEVSLSSIGTVVLTLTDVRFFDGVIYTAFAVGRISGPAPLEVVLVPPVYKLWLPFIARNFSP